MTKLGQGVPSSGTIPYPYTDQAYPQTSSGHQPHSPKKMNPWRMWQKLYGSNKCWDTLDNNIYSTRCSYSQDTIILCTVWKYEALCEILIFHMFTLCCNPWLQQDPEPNWLKKTLYMKWSIYAHAMILAVYFLR